jgi:hypothetical protein
LHEVGCNHQQAVCRHHGLRVVALLKPAARYRHDARVLVGQIDLIAGPGTRRRRGGRLAAGLLAARLGLGLARRDLGFILRLLAGKALAGARLDLNACLGKLFQSFLAPLQFLRDRHPVGYIRLVCRLGLGQQLFHLGLQLRLQLARMLIRKRAMSARIGVDLGPVCPD